MNAKRALFVAEYLKDLNATQAAIRAGYSEMTARATGSRLLTFADVRESVNRGQEKLAKRNDITADWVLERIKLEATREDDNSTHSARVAALRMLANHVSVCIEKKQITGADDGPVRLSVIEEIIVNHADNNPTDETPSDPA